MIDKLYDLTTNDVIGFIKIQKKKKQLSKKKDILKRRAFA
jgi:hypothetical protein